MSRLPAPVLLWLAAGVPWVGMALGVLADGARTVTASRDGRHAPVTESAAAPTDVPIAPEQSIQSVIDANPSATTFVLLTGVHRLTAAISPKAGITIAGQNGAIVSGARVLSSFSRRNAYWAANAQTPENPTSASGGTPVCQPQSPACMRPEDLFVDGVPLRHAGSLDEVGPGAYFIDYKADTVYLADDPRGHVLELAAVPLAIKGNGQSRVTLRHFVVEKFASPAQRGAVWGDGVSGWVIDDLTVRFNHGLGVNFTSSRDVTISNSRLTNNGQLGLGVYDSEHFVLEGTELAYNNYAGYDSNWEAGGAKFSWSRNLTVRHNSVHHNHGAGLWTDTDNLGVLYEGNTASDNADNGIFHEISYDAVIRYNVTERNGKHGILVDASSNVELYANTVRNNARLQQIMARQAVPVTKRGRYGALVLQNFYAHDNVVAGGGSGLLPMNGARGDTTFYTGRDNRFVRNAYDLKGVSSTPFVWMLVDCSEGVWVRYNQDIGGTFQR
jgi:Right handed beta helix region